MSQHAEWLSMIEVSGPFLAVSVLEKFFPQGLESLETYRKKRIRSAYEEWRDAVEEDDPQLPELHWAWIKLVLEELLGYEDSVLEAASDEFTYNSPNGEGQFKPDFVLKKDSGSTPMLFVSIMPEGTDLEKVKIGDGWPVPIFERMTLLCRNKGIRLGLVTNGERWMLVNAPVGSTSSHISWYARLWFQEPVTLKAFQSLLGVRRWFGPEEETLPAMLEDSLQHHEEVTDTLGEQVKRAVEVLVQCLDKADQDRNRELLHDVLPAELYEAGLTVMMRLVFVLCAEERGLLLLNDPIYDQHYAISTLRGQLAGEADQHGHEILERRHDAWARLLAVFRAVYGGIEHESLRMPALGGSLFDPDRFPFLEGRAKGTHWQETPAQPLPIDNRTVLLLLEALQVLEQRGGALLLSYKALDVEQIGHVYEGLLEHTVYRLPKDTLGLIGSQKAKNPNITLADLESARLDGEETLISRIETVTLRSKSAILKGLTKTVDDGIFAKIIIVCGGDMELANRIRPFAHLLRTDAWGDFIVYRANSFAVALGTDRRETGTHYTPKSLTESIVETTLEPVAYVGPVEGKPRDEWLLKSSTELLGLKICDPAMGSGAFLVQVCRWLSERLVEAWGKETGLGKFITVDGIALETAGSAEPMPDSLDERLLIARRLVAEKCLYGVDLNPLAVELAKLSIWLITLAKGRPFGFLDHNLRSGDSLLGIHRLEQLTRLRMDTKSGRQYQLRIFDQNVKAAVNEAIELRKRLRATTIRDIKDVEAMARLNREARRKLESVELIADAIVGETLRCSGNSQALDSALDTLATMANDFLSGNEKMGEQIAHQVRMTLSIGLPKGKSPRKPFHWAVEFPEVFSIGGFCAMIGNPPFIGGRRMRSVIGDVMVEWLTFSWPHSSLNADYCAFFYLRSGALIKQNGAFGFLATKTIGQGDTARTGLSYLIDKMGVTVRYAISSFVWPGTAAVVAALVVGQKGKWNGACVLNKKEVDFISPVLDDKKGWGEALRLPGNISKSFQGSVLVGMGFVLTPEEAEGHIRRSEENRLVIKPYLSGDDLNSHPEQKASRWAIDFRDYSLSECERRWPELVELVREIVKPQRDVTRREAHRKYWWHHGDKRPALYNAVADRSEAFVIARVTKYVAIVKVPSHQIFHDKVYIFDFHDWHNFSSIQSSFHDAWVRRGSSTVGETLNYTPSDYFDTYPFLHLDEDTLGLIGEKYHQFREELMHENQEGLTDTYNRFHNAELHDAQISHLRELHVEMDEAVSSAYGWDDLDLGHGFHETKQGIRFTISEEARCEVLQRLLKLNHDRYEEEVAQGLHDKKNKTSTSQKKKTSKKKNDNNLSLFNFTDASQEESN